MLAAAKFAVTEVSLRNLTYLLKKAFGVGVVVFLQIHGSIMHWYTNARHKNSLTFIS